MDKKATYITKSGRACKRHIDLASPAGRKKIRAREVRAQNLESDKMAQISEEELHVMRTQLMAQQQDLQNARMALEAAQLQQNELANIQQQLQTLQRERDEAHRELRELQQVPQPVAANQQALPASMQQPTPPIQRHAPQQSVSENRNVETIINALNITPIDFKLPSFSDESSCHPLEFLEKLERFFRIKNIVRDDRKISHIETALDGNARLWLDLQQPFVTYENFKIAFNERFHSVPIRVQVKNVWSTREYNPKVYGNFQTFYYKQSKEASYLQPPMSEYEKNYIIMKQFPWWVQEALASINLNNMNDIVHTLANLDVIRTEKQISRDNKQFHQNNYLNSQQQVHVNYMHTRRNYRQNYRGRNRYNSYNDQNNRQYNNQNIRHFPNQNNRNFSYIPSNSTSVNTNNETVALPDVRTPPPSLSQNNVYSSQDSRSGSQSENLNSRSTR